MPSDLKNIKLCISCILFSFSISSDVFIRDFITGEMEIGHIMSKHDMPKKKFIGPLIAPKLPTLTRPFIVNHDEFIFEDPYEEDPKKYDKVFFKGKYGIHTADTDDEAMNAMETGQNKCFLHYKGLSTLSSATKLPIN